MYLRCLRMLPLPPRSTSNLFGCQQPAGRAAVLFPCCSRGARTSLPRVRMGESPWTLLLHCASTRRFLPLLKCLHYGVRRATEMSEDRAGSRGRYSKKENHLSESPRTVRLAQLPPEISPTGMQQSRNITSPLPTSNPGILLSHEA